MSTTTNVLIRCVQDWRILLSAFIIYWLVVFVTRIWFHPLSHIPGPKKGAASYLYHAWYQVWKDGSFYMQRPALHEKYGPVVRISPSDVEVHEPELYHQVYCQKTQFFKDPRHYSVLGFPNSSALCTDPHYHRERRALVQPMFSKKSIKENASVNEVVEKLCVAFEKFCDERKPLPFSSVSYCATVDIISAYLFGESWGMLDEPGFESPWVESVLNLTERINTRMLFPQLGTAIEFIGGIFPTIMPLAFTRLQIQCQRIISDCIEANNAARAAAASGMEKQKPKTIFQSILNPTNERNYRDIPLNHLVEEAMTMLIAGTDSTASLIQFATWRFMTDEEVQWKLLAELDSVSRDEKGHLPLSKLEALPYFTGFIKECLRYYTIAAGRMPRIVPEGGFTVPSTGVHIPAGTGINFCITMIHRDPRIFSEPDKFLPERWFGQQGKELEKWLLSFSKGDRICVGVNLAYTEAYLVLANLFTRFEMVPWETTAEDMEWRDHAVSRPLGRLQVLPTRRVVQV